ncbi:MAG: DUF2911 domain-containing protein [Spirosomaceae bacterium]|nr:DUF2911 domain-containing protein [Spirosomataceae bacterium]
MRKITLFIAVLLSAVITATAQVRTPAASPSAKLEQAVGLSNITVEYSRPSAKGRKVYGELVPFGVLSRTGANQGVKITFSDDVKIDGKDLKKGSYKILTIAGEKEWKVVFHPNLSISIPGGDYKESDEALRISVPVKKLADKVETLTMDFDQIKDGGAELYLAWENTKVGFTIDVMTDPKVEASIKQVMAGPSAGDYLAAASYYANSGKDINKALEWAKKGVDMGANQFWNLRQYSLILAKAGKYADAIATAKESLKKATEAKNNDYIKMNNDSIAEWSKK